MFKFKKLFGLALLTAVVGMFTIACEETTDEDGYTVKITGGTITGVTGSSAVFFEGDAVTITADVPSGKKFVEWKFTGATISDVNKVKNPFTFAMPAVNITITAIFEDVGEPEGFYATIIGGTIYFEDEEGDEYYVEDGETGIFYEYDPVVTIAADPPAGKVFLEWTVSPAKYLDRFVDVYDPITAFVMPSDDVTITANFGTPVDGNALIRYAWTSVENDLIQYIFADAENIEWWYEDIYGDGSIVDEDFVIRDEFMSSFLKAIADGNPYPGIAGMPEIFKLGGENNNNGEYFDAPAGSYIAVCSVEDPNFANTIWEIVADYAITVNSGARPADKLFEIGFNLTKFLDGDDDYGWYGLEPGEDDEPLLAKKKNRKAMYKTQKVVKAGASMDVTYFAFPRTKKI